MRRRRLGLRPRLLAAMLATAGVTLLAVALALLPSLQDQLRKQAVDGLEGTTLSSVSSVERLLRAPTGAEAQDGRLLQRRDPDSSALELSAFDLADRVDGRVVILRLDPSAPDGAAPSRSVVDTLSGGPSLPSAPLFAALVDPPARGTAVRLEDGDSALVITPLFKGDDQVGLLATQKRLTDVATAVAQVRRAFLAAALVGLAVATVLALGLATTLVRRLRRLRQAALRITRDGPAAPPPPTDTVSDEVGDLGRALTTMQAELRRQEQARRAFVATASHELRTPLTSLGWSLELLHDDLEAGDFDVEEARRQVTGARTQAARLQRLAAELLDLSRLDAEVEVRSEPVELGELARAVGAEFERRFEEGGVALEVSAPPGPCWGRGDPGAIARIVRILLDNALRFAPAGSAVRVTPAYAGAHATITVDDAGPGVPEEEGDRIFERFQRGSRTGGEGGFGLGLAIGRELARRQDGDLVLASPAGKPGARFVLRLAIELPTGTSSPAGRGSDAVPARGA